MLWLEARPCPPLPPLPPLPSLPSLAAALAFLASWFVLCLFLSGEKRLEGSTRMPHSAQPALLSSHATHPSPRSRSRGMRSALPLPVLLGVCGDGDEGFRPSFLPLRGVDGEGGGAEMARVFAAEVFLHRAHPRTLWRHLPHPRAKEEDPPPPPPLFGFGDGRTVVVDVVAILFFAFSAVLLAVGSLKADAYLGALMPAALALHREHPRGFWRHLPHPRDGGDEEDALIAAASGDGDGGDGAGVFIGGGDSSTSGDGLHRAHPRELWRHLPHPYAAAAFAIFFFSVVFSLIDATTMDLEALDAAVAVRRRPGMVWWIG